MRRVRYGRRKMSIGSTTESRSARTTPTGVTGPTSINTSRRSPGNPWSVPWWWNVARRGTRVLTSAEARTRTPKVSPFTFWMVWSRFSLHMLTCLFLLYISICFFWDLEKSCALSFSWSLWCYFIFFFWLFNCLKILWI